MGTKKQSTKTPCDQNDLAEEVLDLTSPYDLLQLEI
jgi:hypothetical protein